MATLTVIILAKNEEQHMKDCIASAQLINLLMRCFLSTMAARIKR